MLDPEDAVGVACTFALTGPIAEAAVGFAPGLFKCHAGGFQLSRAHFEMKFEFAIEGLFVTMREDGGAQAAEESHRYSYRRLWEHSSTHRGAGPRPAVLELEELAEI
jgi:hypothetical protein